MTLSPTFASMRGRGHCPLIPMVVFSYCPSGFVVNQPAVKLYTRVAAEAYEQKQNVLKYRKLDKERAMAPLYVVRICDSCT